MQGGKKETVESLTAEELKAYHAKYFTGPNLVVSVFGDVDPEKTIEVLTRIFGQADSKPVEPPVAFKRPNTLSETKTLHKTINKETGLVIIGFSGTSILDEKDYAALTVLDTIMSGYTMPGGWLHRELRGEGLVYWVTAFQLTGPAPGYLMFMAPNAAGNRRRSGPTHPQKRPKSEGRPDHERGVRHGDPNHHRNARSK